MRLFFKKLYVFLFNYKYQVFLHTILFAAVLFMSYLILFQPSALSAYYKPFKNDKPETLKSTRGSFFGDYNIRVHKVKHKNKMYLRVRRGSEIVEQLLLKGSQNGFFEYWGDSLSLAFIDDNGDGVLEIIAPTFDDFFKPHLNVIFYDDQKENFKLKESLKIPPQFQ